MGGWSRLAEIQGSRPRVAFGGPQGVHVFGDFDLRQVNQIAHCEPADRGVADGGEADKAALLQASYPAG